MLLVQSPTIIAETIWRCSKRERRHMPWIWYKQIIFPVAWPLHTDQDKLADTWAVTLYKMSIALELSGAMDVKEKH